MRLTSFNLHFEVENCRLVCHVTRREDGDWELHIDIYVVSDVAHPLSLTNFKAMIAPISMAMGMTSPALRPAQKTTSTAPTVSSTDVA